MKKYIFAALALLAIACAKEDVEQQPAPQPITINVADFPTTRADSYGKTAWEAGDKLMVQIVGYNFNPVHNWDDVNERSLHTLTYNGTNWSIDTPIGDLTEYGERYEIMATYCPNMHMEWNNTHDAYFITKTTNDQNPYLSEYLCDMYCYFDSETNTLDIPFDSFARNNRIRVNYKPNTEIIVSLDRVDYAVYYNWLAREAESEDYEEDVEFNVTTDNDGNAFIYAMWHGYSLTPEVVFVSNPTITIKSSNGSKTLREATDLPYTEGRYWANDIYDDETTPEDERAGGRAFVLTVPQE